MAEVLITLGILGIVIAMTLPGVIKGYQKKETTTRLKKAYTVLSQAILLSQVDNGSIENWDINNISPDNFYQIYLKKYIKHSHKIGSGRDLYNLVGGYKSLNGNASTAMSYNPRCRYIEVSDGSMIILLSPGHINWNNIHIDIDINGRNKPNQWGKDMFSFVFSPDYGLQAYGTPNSPVGLRGNKFDREKILGTGNENCNKQSSGAWCTAILMHDNWEIKDDYPW